MHVGRALVHRGQDHVGQKVGFVNVGQVARRGVDHEQVVTIHLGHADQGLEAAGMLGLGVGPGVLLHVHEHHMIGALEARSAAERQETGQVSRVAVEVEAGDPEAVLDRRNAQKSSNGGFARAAFEAADRHNLHGPSPSRCGNPDLR